MPLLPLRLLIDQSQGEGCAHSAASAHTRSHDSVDGTREQHHCRLCGNVYCGSCARHTWRSEGRACDDCYQRLSRRVRASSDASGGKRRKRAWSAIDWKVGDLDTDSVKCPWAVDDMLPEWSAPFVPLLEARREAERAQLLPASRRGRKQPPADALALVAKGIFGLLDVELVEAEDVLAADMHFAGLGGPATSDPFCVLEVGHHDVVGDRTRVIDSTVNPVWNHRVVLPVKSPSAKISVTVYDHDSVGSDDPLGRISVPISALASQEEQDLWLHLQYTEEMNQAIQRAAAPSDEAGAASSTSATPEKDRKAEARAAKLLKLRRQHSRPSGAADADAAGGPASAGEGAADGGERPAWQGEDCGLGRIHVRLRLRYSPLGELLAHFQPESAPTPEPEDFSVNAMYGAAMHLLNQIMPIINAILSIVTMISWTTPWWSALCLAIFIFLCLNPGWIPVYLHLLILRSLFWNYVAERYRKNEPHAIVHVDDAREDAGKLAEFVVVQDKDKKAKEAATLGKVGAVADAVVTAGLADWLGGIQGTLRSTADLIAMIYGLFDWTSPSTTAGVTYGVLGSLVVHALVPFHYILLVVGIVVFGLQTTPWRLTLGGIMGTLSYFTQSLSRTPEAKARASRTRAEAEAARRARARTGFRTTAPVADIPQ